MLTRLLVASLTLLLLAGCMQSACERTPTPAEVEASFSKPPPAEDIRAALERDGWNVTPRPSAPQLSAQRSLEGLSLELNVTLLQDAPATTVLRMRAPDHPTNTSAGARAILAPAMDALLQGLADVLGPAAVVHYRGGTSACEDI